MNKIINKIRTIKDCIRWVSSQFSRSYIYYGHGCDNYLDEALNLVLSSIFLPLSWPLELYDTLLTYQEKIKIINRSICRIEKRIPVSYLTNISWFCGLEFYVDERVLIPRSPISELIINNFYNLLPNNPKHILDMCTGSACIAIACAYRYRNAEIDAVDISIDALSVAELNIQSHNLEHCVVPIYSDLFLNLPLLHYDLIITNPPYLEDNEVYNLPHEFYSEPIIGLYAGKDSLYFINRILFYAPNYLSDKGILICEIGSSMVHLINRYPHIPFHWIKLINGGIGVFMLTRQQLVLYHDLFKI